MKIFTVLFVAVIGVALAAVAPGETVYPGVRFFPSARLLARTTTTPTVVSIACPAGTFGYHCANDCKTRMHCFGDAGPKNTNVCSGSTPYCVGSACQAAAGELDTCLAVNGNTESLKCFKGGYYPNPYDCTKYFYCDAANTPMEPEHSECATANTVYNAEVQACVVKKKSADCVVLEKQCTSSSNANKYIAYSGDPAVFAYCFHQGKFKDIYLSRCDDQYEFDATSGTCVLSCNGEAGLFADPGDDCSVYYQCVKSGSKFVATKLACGTEQAFDATTGRCQRDVTCSPKPVEEVPAEEVPVDGVPVAPEI